MAFAQGSRSGLAYIKEVDFGVTPNTPTLQEIFYNTHSLNVTKERVQGNAIISDRMPRVDRHGNKQAVGDIAVDLLAGDYDWLLESMLFNEFQGDVLKSGVTPQFYTIEDFALDIGQFRQFRGMAVSQGTFSIAPNQMITSTFSLAGKGGEIVQATIGTGTNTQPSANQPFDSYSGVLTIDGTPASIISSIEFSVNNSLAPTFVIGDDETPQLEYGMAAVEGTITAYYQDEDFLRRFLDETETEIVVELSDPGALNTYRFTFPRVKINGGEVPVANPQSRFITAPFVAIYDATAQSHIVIERITAS